MGIKVLPRAFPGTPAPGRDQWQKDRSPSSGDRGCSEHMAGNLVNIAATRVAVERGVHVGKKTWCDFQVILDYDDPAEPIDQVAYSFDNRIREPCIRVSHAIFRP